jgi:hypothetical protein
MGGMAGVGPHVSYDLEAAVSVVSQIFNWLNLAWKTELAYPANE